MQQKNWSKQLTDLALGEKGTFPTKSYEVILQQRKRLQQAELGTWESLKERGAKTFTMTRTSMPETEVQDENA